MKSCTLSPSSLFPQLNQITEHISVKLHPFHFISEQIKYLQAKSLLSAHMILRVEKKIKDGRGITPLRILLETVDKVNF